jgi:hypothetical protein
VSRTGHHLPFKYRDDLPRDVRFLVRVNGSSSLTMLANRLERRARAAARTHSLLVISRCRGGGPDDIDDLAEPDGRPRHGAHWLFF